MIRYLCTIALCLVTLPAFGQSLPDSLTNIKAQQQNVGITSADHTAITYLQKQAQAVDNDGPTTVTVGVTGPSGVLVGSYANALPGSASNATVQGNSNVGPSGGVGINVKSAIACGSSWTDGNAVDIAKTTMKGVSVAIAEYEVPTGRDEQTYTWRAKLAYTYVSDMTGDAPSSTIFFGIKDGGPLSGSISLSQGASSPNAVAQGEWDGSPFFDEVVPGSGGLCIYERYFDIVASPGDVIEIICLTKNTPDSGFLKLEGTNPPDNGESEVNTCYGKFTYMSTTPAP